MNGAVFVQPLKRSSTELEESLDNSQKEERDGLLFYKENASPATPRTPIKVSEPAPLFAVLSQKIGMKSCTAVPIHSPILRKTARIAVRTLVM